MNYPRFILGIAKSHLSTIRPHGLAAARYDHLDKERLHTLRIEANKVLHDAKRAESLSIEGEEKILQFFRDLKFYIEKAPSK